MVRHSAQQQQLFQAKQLAFPHRIGENHSPLPQLLRTISKESGIPIGFAHPQVELEEKDNRSLP